MRWLSWSTDEPPPAPLADDQVDSEPLDAYVTRAEYEQLEQRINSVEQVISSLVLDHIQV